MDRPHLRLLCLLFLTAATFPLSGCLFRTRTLDRQFSNQPLKTATQQDLIEYVNAQAAKIQSMQATVDIDASAGDTKNGRVTDYKEIRGYVLARKPAMLRMKGLLPLVRNTAFDMVSDGQEFKLWIPPKNKFFVGLDDGDNYQPDKRLENMRPQYIYDALLIPQVGRDEIAVMENGYETVLDAKKHRVEQPNYALAVILSMVKLEINRALTDDQFALEQPPGAEVVHLDSSNTRAAAKGSESHRRYVSRKSKMKRKICWEAVGQAGECAV